MGIIKGEMSPSQPPKLLDQLRNLMRMRHMSHKTERSYVAYIWQYLEFIADQRLVMLGLNKVYGAKFRSRSWTGRTYKNSPISSNAVSPPTKLQLQVK
jgi:hypothetical protein